MASMSDFPAEPTATLVQDSSANEPDNASAGEAKSRQIAKTGKKRGLFNLSILQRVTLSQTLYILLFAAATALVFAVNSSQQRAVETVDVNGIYAAHAAAGDLGAALVDADGKLAAALMRSDAAAKDAAAKALAAVERDLSALDQILQPLPDSQIKAQLMPAFSDLRKAAAQYLSLTAQALNGRQELQGSQILSLNARITAGINQLEQVAMHGIYSSATGAGRYLSYTELAMFAGLGLMLLCFIITTVSLRRSLRKNASIVLKALKRIEKGDLSVRINPRSGDEIGQIAALTDSFVDSSDKTLGLIRSDIERLHEMVGSNRTALDTTNSAILDQRNKAQYVATATAEMEDAVEQVADFAKSTLKEVKSAEEASETCRRTMSDNITTTHTLSDRLRDSSEAINRIHEMGDKINSIVKTIEDIADQTNLLSLNATIEAARSGEAGRGFAIVADEVRNLANKTAVSTKEVRDTINELDEAVINSVKVMASCEGEMNNSLAQSSRANSSIEEIMGIIATISDMSEQIVSSCEKQAASAGEINRSIANISKLAEDNYEHMSGIHTSMSELDELATSQARVLSGFTLSRAQGGEEV